MALIRSAIAKDQTRSAIVLDLGDIQRQGEALRDEAQREAERIVEEARRERERLISDARDVGLEQGRTEGLERGRAEGIEQGRAEAMEAGRGEIEGLIQSWGDALDAFEFARDSLLVGARADVLRLALAIAERVVKRVVEAAPDVVEEQLEEALKIVLNPTRLVIRVHPEDRAVAGDVAPRLMERLHGAAHCDLVDDDGLPRGSCVVRTERGEVDARIDTQLERLIGALAPAAVKDAPHASKGASG